MRDANPSFVCPNRECHRQSTADAHKIANMGGKLNEAIQSLQNGTPEQQELARHIIKFRENGYRPVSP